MVRMLLAVCALGVAMSAPGPSSAAESAYYATEATAVIDIDVAGAVESVQVDGVPG